MDLLGIDLLVFPNKYAEPLELNDITNMNIMTNARGLMVAGVQRFHGAEVSVQSLPPGQVFDKGSAFAVAHTTFRVGMAVGRATTSDDFGYQESARIR